VAKKELREFRPIVQTTYLQMHQVDAIADSEWNSLVASKPKECITDATQQFVVEASLLARKWQDKVDNFQEVRKRALELVPELGPSFEEDKEETVQAGNGSNLEPEGKKEQQANPETMEESKT
jgi:hypothetical protein